MTDIETGQLLLAQPFMDDSNFKRSAILLCDHQDDGSIGFVLNKRLEINIDELIGDFPEFDAPVFFGGPVQQDTIHYVHRLGDLLEDCHYVTDGIYWGGDFKKLKILISQELVKPNDIRFFVGYTGWSSGQIANELKHGSWVVANMFANYLFKVEPKNIWQKAMENKGNTFSVIAQVPEISPN